MSLFRRAKKCGDLVKHEVRALPFVSGEPGGLGQVILNLLENALHATEGVSPIQVRASSTDSTIRIQVIDQGPGISVDAQKHIFEPFFTTKEVGEGTGLGLYICQEIIRRLNGTLTFETSPQGTTFTIELKVG